MMGSFTDMHVRLVLSGKNLGFAEGVNSGLPYCSQPYVLLLNDDAALEPGSLGILVSEMQRVAPDVVGLAPKVLLDLPEPVIDNVGAAITPDGSVHNRGYNQKDIGQFDEQVDVAGACLPRPCCAGRPSNCLMWAHSTLTISCTQRTPTGVYAPVCAATGLWPAPKRW